MKNKKNIIDLTLLVVPMFLVGSVFRCATVKGQDSCSSCKSSEFQDVIRQVEEDYFSEARKGVLPDHPLTRRWYNHSSQKKYCLNFLSGFCLYELDYPSLNRKSFLLVDLLSKEPFKLGGWALDDNSSIKLLLSKYVNLKSADSVCVCFAQLIYQYYLDFDSYPVVLDSIDFGKYPFLFSASSLPKVIREDYGIKYQSYHPAYIEVVFLSKKEEEQLNIVDIRLYENGEFEYTIIPLS